MGAPKSAAEKKPGARNKAARSAADKQKDAEFSRFRYHLNRSKKQVRREYKSMDRDEKARDII